MPEWWLNEFTYCLLIFTNYFLFSGRRGEVRSHLAGGVHQCGEKRPNVQHRLARFSLERFLVFHIPFCLLESKMLHKRGDVSVINEIKLLTDKQNAQLRSQKWFSSKNFKESKSVQKFRHIYISMQMFTFPYAGEVFC